MLLITLFYLAFSLALALASQDYSESLLLKPLARNNLLASFQFTAQLPAFQLEYTKSRGEISGPRHFGRFPRSLAPILQATNTRELHMRFTQGWWDSEKWGKLPMNGSVTGGTGVEVWAAIEAFDADEARVNWLKLAESLSGFFCALLNFVDDAITTFPRYRDLSANFVLPENKLFLMRAALPDEPICTENLTPFLKMLPTRGKAGISSLLDGHKLYDSLWHSMSIDVVTECADGKCNLKLDLNIHQIVDVMRLMRRKNEGGIPKPVPGDKLRCDPTKKSDSWFCFPLGDETELEWDLASMFGPIKGSGFQDEPVSVVKVEVDPEHWTVHVDKDYGDSGVSHEISSEPYTLEESASYNFKFKTSDSRYVVPVESPPVLVSRSLTGYSQDRGGMRVTFQNPSAQPVTLVYFESLPWFMRVYLHTLQSSGSGTIDSHFYKPAIDRARPGHLELVVTIPALESFTLTYLFDKSLLLYAEYPPDANHGFAVEPAVVKVLENNATVYQMRTASLLLTLPTPDFSMPYNVIILTCTVMSLAFGTIFNLLTKKVVTEEEAELASKQSVLSKLKTKAGGIKAKLGLVKVPKRAGPTSASKKSE